LPDGTRGWDHASTAFLEEKDGKTYAVHAEMRAGTDGFWGMVGSKNKPINLGDLFDQYKDVLVIVIPGSKLPDGGVQRYIDVIKGLTGEGSEYSLLNGIGDICSSAITKALAAAHGTTVSGGNWLYKPNNVLLDVTEQGYGVPSTGPTEYFGEPLEWFISDEIPKGLESHVRPDDDSEEYDGLESHVQPDNPDLPVSNEIPKGLESHVKPDDDSDAYGGLESHVQPDNPDLPDTDSPNSFINVAHRAFEISPEMTRDALRAEDARTDGASQKPTTDDDQKASEEQVALTSNTEHARVDNPDQQPATDDDEEASPEQVALTSDTEHARVDNPDQQPATHGIYKTGPSGITVRMAERPEDIDSDSPNPPTDGNQGTSPLQDHDNAGESAGIPDNPDSGFSYAAFIKPGVPVEAGKEAMPVEQPSPEGNSSSETPVSESAHPDIGSEDVGNAAPTKEPVVHHGDLAP
jgi:hypothetical protein